MKRMKILIGYDGSDCAEAALDDLARAGLLPEAEALVISVTELWLPPPPPSSFQVIEEAHLVNVPADLKSVYEIDTVMDEEARKQAIKAGERLKAKFPGWSVETEAFYGSPARELILKAEKWGADCIFLGSTGLGRLKRFLLGSVSAAVAARASCSVEVIRNPQRTESHEPKLNSA